MSLTCDSWIPVLSPHLCEALVDAEALRRLRSVARHLPGDCLGVLEVRLAERPGSGAVDVSLRLTEPPARGGWIESLAPPHLREFLCDGWRSIGHPDPLSSVWLEFDLDLSPQGLPVPVVCARLQGPAEADWLADTLLPALHGGSLQAAQRRWVRRSVAEIPACGRILYAYSLLSRPGAAVRLELFGLDPAAMVDYLERIGTPEGAGQVAEVAHLIADGDRYHLSFDIGESVAARIGVECSFVRLPHREPGWAALFHRLVDHGLCSAEKRDSVFAWPGTDTLRTAAREWPPERRIGGGSCVRCLSHVKLLTWPDRAPEAKAYLLFQPLGPKPSPSRTSGERAGPARR